MQGSLKTLVSLILVLCCLCAGCAASEEKSDEDLLSFYENSVFAGDSITGQFKRYVTITRRENPDFLKNVTIVSADSLSLQTARVKNIHTAIQLTYKGRTMPLWQVVEKVQPEKLFVLLGVNDYIGLDIPKGMRYIEDMVNLMQETNPTVQVYFFSLTPVTKSFSGSRNLQKHWDEYNVALEEKCAELGVGFIDIATALKGPDGYVKKGYSSDGKFHLSTAGIECWIESMKDYVRSLPAEEEEELLELEEDEGTAAEGGATPLPQTD